MLLAIPLYLHLIIVPLIKGINIKTNRETPIDKWFTETFGNKIESIRGIYIKVTNDNLTLDPLHMQYLLS